MRAASAIGLAALGLAACDRGAAVPGDRAGEAPPTSAALPFRSESAVVLVTIRHPQTEPLTVAVRGAVTIIGDVALAPGAPFVRDTLVIVGPDSVPAAAPVARGPQG